MPTVILPDRAVISISGPDAEHLLQNLVTTDLDALTSGEAKAGALLTPQGKIMFDFLISRDGADGFRIDLRADAADDFLRRMMMYRLRAKAEIAKRDQVVVGASWGDESAGSGPDSSASGFESTKVKDTRFRGDEVWRLYVDDPSPSRSARHLSPEGRGTQAGIPQEQKTGTLVSPPLQDPGSSPLWGEVARRAGEGLSDTAYTTLRIANAVAESGPDYPLSDAFPHDVLLEQVGGVGFSKGCFVGQEVVSRMKHRGTARRRVLIVRGAAALPASGTDLTVDGKVIGALGSVQGADGLAIVRIDKVKAAIDAAQPILAGDVPVTLSIPSWATFGFPADPAPGDPAPTDPTGNA